MTYLAVALVLLGLAASAIALWRRDARRVSNLREVLELQYLEEDERPTAEHAASLLARSGSVAERALSGTPLLNRLASVVLPTASATSRTSMGEAPQQTPM